MDFIRHLFLSVWFSRFGQVFLVSDYETIETILRPVFVNSGLSKTGKGELIPAMPQ
jgi:hypothetical protein